MHSLFSSSRGVKAALLGAATALAALCGAAASAAPLTWTQVYDQSVPSTSSETLTRSLRGLALADDDSSIYGGFIQKSLGSGVRQFSLPGGTPGGFYNVNASSNGPSSTDHQPKAVATDDRGLVFIGSSKDSTSGDNARVIISSSTLTGTPTVVVLPDIASPGSVTSERVNGLSVVTIGGTRYLYTSREHPNSAYVERYVIGGTDATNTTLTLDLSFNGTGRINIRNSFAGASDLRGLEVAADGTIYVTSHANDAVYRISSDLSSITRQTVNNAMDLALFDGRVFVTSYNAASSAIFELMGTTTLDILSSFDAFGYFPRGLYGNENDTGYSGIDIDANGRIYLADQFYVLRRGTPGGTNDVSNDRILVSSPLALLGAGGDVPEPAGLALMLAGLAALAAVRRRRAQR